MCGVMKHFFISDMAKCKMYNKFRFYSIVVQRNIFHRCFELHLLHLDDERDLHRAAPRDVTLENRIALCDVCVMCDVMCV